MSTDYTPGRMYAPVTRDARPVLEAALCGVCAMTPRLHMLALALWADAPGVDPGGDAGLYLLDVEAGEVECVGCEVLCEEEWPMVLAEAAGC